jgi:glycosyltransferase involved in cell wall biosynthesis
MLEGVDAFPFTALEQAHPRQSGASSGPRRSPRIAEGSRSALTRPEARRITGISGSPALLFVGRLDRNKDPLTVLDGFEAAALPASSLTMVHASDELLPEVRRRVASSPFLQERVSLRGRVPYGDMAAFLSAADLFVLGSHKEGSGYSLIEAHCGAFPAVTDIPSFRAITGDGAAGVLWPPGLPLALASALRRLAAQDLGRLSAEARAHFESRLSWSAIGRRALQIYREVVDERRSASQMTSNAARHVPGPARPSAVSTGRIEDRRRGPRNHGPT